MTSRPPAAAAPPRPPNAQEDTAAPPLGLSEAEELVRRLMPALKEHGQWVKRIHKALICRTPPEPEDIAADSHLRSDLGRWFAEEDVKFVRRHPQHRLAYDTWLEQHAHARELSRTVAAGQPILPADYEAFAESIRSFDHAMEVLVHELWDLLLHTDPLTGITTRAGMLPHLHAAHRHMRRVGHACSLCMIDLDRFKRINDHYGHAAGDRVLAAISGFLVRNLRHNDHLSRYGGEEFVLMLPNTDPMQALDLVERLRHDLADLPIVLDDGRILHVTASFGIAPLTPHHSVRDSLAMADQAMYAAKQAGRNQVCVWQED